MKRNDAVSKGLGSRPAFHSFLAGTDEWRGLYQWEDVSAEVPTVWTLLGDLQLAGQDVIGLGADVAAAVAIGYRQRDGR